MAASFSSKSTLPRSMEFLPASSSLSLLTYSKCLFKLYMRQNTAALETLKKLEWHLSMAASVLLKEFCQGSMELLPPLPLRPMKPERQQSDDRGRSRCCLGSIESVILWFHGCVLFSKIARQSAYEDSSGLCLLLLLCKERTNLCMRERYCYLLKIQKAITAVHGCVLPFHKKSSFTLSWTFLWPLPHLKKNTFRLQHYGRERNLGGARRGIKQLSVFLGYDILHHTPLSQQPKHSWR